MRGRSLERTSGRKKKISLSRKQNHELNGIPTEFHENGAPEYTPLPDEYNRFTPAIDTEEQEEERRARLRRMMMGLMAVGACVLGLFLFGKSRQAQTKDAALPTVAPMQTQKPDKTSPEPTLEASAEATATAIVTQTPTAEPTAAPTQEPDIAGVSLEEAEWIDGTGSDARFRIVARIPKKNAEKGIQIGDFYAWLDGEGTIEDWDAIMTPSEFDTTFSENEYGDTIVTFFGTLYWPSRTPSAGGEVTIAATGWDRSTDSETEASNALTVRFGQRVEKEH